MLAFSGWYFFSKKNVVAYYSDQPLPKARSSNRCIHSPPRHLFGSVLLGHAVISGTAAVGLWKLKAWA